MPGPSHYCDAPTEGKLQTFPGKEGPRSGGQRATQTRCGLDRFAGHDEQRLHLEALVMRTQTVNVVVLSDVHDLLRGSHYFDGHVVVSAILQDHQSPVDLAEQQIERKIAVRHRHYRIDCVWIAAADEVSELLVDGVDGFAVVEFG